MPANYSLEGVLLEILGRCPVPSSGSLEAWIATLRNLRIYVQQLANAAGAVTLPVEVAWSSSLGSWEVLALEEDPEPQVVSGKRLQANLALRSSACDRCGGALDYLGSRKAWHCTKVGCARSIRRDPERRRERAGWRSPA